MQHRLGGLALLAAVAMAPAARADPPHPFAYAPDDTSKMLAVAARQQQRTEGLFGRVALAFLANRGNTDATSLNAEFDLGYLSGAWRHAGRLQGLLGASNGERNAEALRFSEQSDYTFSNNNYAFAAIDSQYDRFGPYLRRTSVTAGLGRRLIDLPHHGLDVQLGLGSSWSRRPGEPRVQEGVLVSALRYEWKINDRAAFTERLNVEAHSTNTYTESVTALTTNIQGALALSVSYSLRHNSNVPPDRRKNDSATAVSLIYGF